MKFINVRAISMKTRIVVVGMLLATALVCATVQLGFAGDFTTVPPGDYVVGPEDELQIYVWDDETLSPRVQVRPDGKFTMPLIGEIQAAGRTVEQIRSEVEAKVRPYVPDSPVSVSVDGLNYPKVYLLGKVNRPGVHVMSRYMTVAQALSLGGGFSPFAETTDILVVRWINGEQHTFKFDYEDVSRGLQLEQNIWVEPGDLIVIP